jgi:hypothetical protein
VLGKRRLLVEPVKASLAPKLARAFRAKGSGPIGPTDNKTNTLVKAAIVRGDRFRLHPVKHSQ